MSEGEEDVKRSGIIALIATTVSLFGLCSAAEDVPAHLDPVDAEMLSATIATRLVDPHGKSWVGVLLKERTVWGRNRLVVKHGWMSAISPGHEHDIVVTLTDGEVMTQHMDPVPLAHDFIAECREFLDQGIMASDTAETSFVEDARKR